MTAPGREGGISGYWPRVNDDFLCSPIGLLRVRCGAVFGQHFTAESLVLSGSLRFALAGATVSALLVWAVLVISQYVLRREEVGDVLK